MFERLFKRSSAPVDDAVEPQVSRAPLSPTKAQALGIASVQACLSLVERGFVAARPMPKTEIAAQAFTPSARAMIGRSLVAYGESVSLIEVVNGRLRLIPAFTWDVQGGSDEDDWVYDLSLPGPTRQRDIVVEGRSVFHVRIGATAVEPWRGLSPLETAYRTILAAASAESSMGNEANRPGGQLVAVPDATPDQMALLQQAIDAGDAAVVSPQAQPHGQMASVRVGSALDPTADAFRNRLVAELAAAVGVPSVMIQGGPGASSREALRQFASVTLEPMAARIGEEAQKKLDASDDFHLDFSDLAASDLRTRANAMSVLMGEPVNMSEEDARRLVGW